MYESHFQFQTRPFAAAPLVENYVPAAGMEHCRQTLIRCVERAEGPGLVVGGAGSGKSLLCQLLADHFRGQQFQVALLASARLGTRRALLQNILFELHLPYRGMEEGELRLSLIDHLEPRGMGLAGLLLLVDEAHCLPLRLLEEIRLISNFIRDGQPRVRLILAGSAQLEERLASPKLESLQQRIAARCYLQSLSREETAQFIRQQIQRAGGSDSLFTAEALRAVYSATDGVPRLVSQVCDHALVLSALGGHTQISAEAIEEAWADLQQLPAPWHQTSARESAPVSTVIEFGQLQDDEAAVHSTAAEPTPTQSRGRATLGAEFQETPAELRAGENLDRMERGLNALDSAEGIELGTFGAAYEDAREFEPVGDARTQVELTFHTPANPFGDGFDEEEIVVDRYANMAANYVSDLIDQQDGTGEIAAQILELAKRTAESARPAAVKPPPAAIEVELPETETEMELEFTEAAALGPGVPEEDVRKPLRVHVASETFHPASDPVLPEEKSVTRRDEPRREQGGAAAQTPRVPHVVQHPSQPLTPGSRMSHLLKALRSLETRGAAFAPPPDGLEVQDAVSKTSVLAVEEAIELMADGGPAAVPTQELPARIKPRPAPRVKPRRTTQSPVDLFAGRPLIERLGQDRQPPVAKKLEDAPAETAASLAQSQHYTLAPAVVVNQDALDAGAALARELAVPAALPEPSPSSAPAVAPQPVPPLRTPTLFEQRIREALLHPARSRPFAELVQRLRLDFRGSQERSLLFTGIGRASRGDEMLAHVAALFAEQGERVLLVDADFERSGLSAGFGGGTLGGLQNAIIAPRTWQDHLLTTSFPNLSILPTGRGNLNVAGAGETLTSLIPKLEAEFPLVLIDGGQSSGSLLTPLARACDATYFVIRLGATDAKEAQGALKSFRAAGARVMGCVATMDVA